MRIAVLTSSRADYSIYLPLLKAMNSDSFFDLEIIAFGTHVSRNHGYTIDAIKLDGFKITYAIESLIMGDSPEAIATAMGTTIIKFSSIWSCNKYDLVFVLGDRYEMFAAVASTVPFNIPLAHIHGGETTLGAIDDCFRHSITLMSKYHFTVAEDYKKRVIELTGNTKNVYNVGSLSYDNLKTIKYLSIEEFKKQFKIDLSIPSILITFHPETVSYEKNEEYITELVLALQEIKGYQLIITMPNTDTMGSMIREKLNKFISQNIHAIGVESFGTLGYLSCMKHCSFMLGNTSSGFAEAAFFPKYVINIGDRQKGRIVTSNIINTEIRWEKIVESVKKIITAPVLNNITAYGTGDAAIKIVEVIKNSFKSC